MNEHREAKRLKQTLGNFYLTHGADTCEKPRAAKRRRRLDKALSQSGLRDYRQGRNDEKADG